jgi:hypothetical protein
LAGWPQSTQTSESALEPDLATIRQPQRSQVMAGTVQDLTLAAASELVR